MPWNSSGGFGVAYVLSLHLNFHQKSFSLEPVVMVGDGATDMEARLEGAADLFIGYGGVVERKNIAEKADVSLNNDCVANI